eukprot:scaffold277661_cov36-Prasinocladus_malaysianus.AAC.1
MIGPDDRGTFAYFPRRMQEEDARNLIFLHHNGLHVGMARNFQPGTHIPGQDIVVPPLQIAPHIRNSQVLQGLADRLAPRKRLLFFSGTILDWDRLPGAMQVNPTERKSRQRHRPLSISFMCFLSLHDNL